VVTSVVVQAVARLLLAPILMIAFAILVKGYAEVGDGFSAGAIAALGVLLHYVAFGRATTERLLPIRALPAACFAALLLALALATGPLVFGDPVLTYAPSPGAEVVQLGTLEVIGAVAFDVAVFVIVMGAALGIIHALARQAEEIRE